MTEAMQALGIGPWLPLIFAGLMGFAILVYVLLDGYDLGVGMLFLFATDEEKSKMIATIGPFWDANETWLVLAVGVLLVAFPVAHGVVLTALYIPVVVMLFGLILRGVSFEFRAKVHAQRVSGWNRNFFVGSLLASLAQGYMLGRYVLGLEFNIWTFLFGLLTAAGLVAGYVFIGSCWLILKTADALQAKAIRWARRSIGLTALAVGAVSIATPLASERIFNKWFAWPEIAYLAPLPLLTLTVLAGLGYFLTRPQATIERRSWLPYAGAIVLAGLSFAGLAYSFFPYVVPERITIVEAASAPESLFFILIGALIVVPVMIAYSAYAYYVFRGKAHDLHY